jgi:hypothetical protein
MQTVGQRLPGSGAEEGLPAFAVCRSSLRATPSSRPANHATEKLLELELEIQLLARIKGADCLDGAFLFALFGPDLEVIDHAYLGKAKGAIWSAGEAPDVAGLEVLEEDRCAANDSAGIIDNFSLNDPLSEVLGFGDLWTQVCTDLWTCDWKKAENCSRHQGGKNQPGLSSA